MYIQKMKDKYRQGKKIKNDNDKTEIKKGYIKRQNYN